MSSTLDMDNDGVPDSIDAFPNDPTETEDMDGDGVGNVADQFPMDPTESKDNDKDGVGNNADRDDDNDGVLDENDELPFDRFETKDADNDGVGDIEDAFPNDPSETKDTDGDGVGDNTDQFTLDHTETKDTDADGVGDNADAFPNDATRSAHPLFHEVHHGNFSGGNYQCLFSEAGDVVVTVGYPEIKTFFLDREQGWISRGTFPNNLNGDLPDRPAFSFKRSGISNASPNFKHVALSGSGDVLLIASPVMYVASHLSQAYTQIYRWNGHEWGLDFTILGYGYSPNVDRDGNTVTVCNANFIAVYSFETSTWVRKSNQAVQCVVPFTSFDGGYTGYTTSNKPGKFLDELHFVRSYLHTDNSGVPMGHYGLMQDDFTPGNELVVLHGANEHGRFTVPPGRVIVGWAIASGGQTVLVHTAPPTIGGAFDWTKDYTTSYVFHRQNEADWAMNEFPAEWSTISPDGNTLAVILEQETAIPILKTPIKDSFSSPEHLGDPASVLLSGITPKTAIFKWPHASAPDPEKVKAKIIEVKKAIPELKPKGLAHDINVVGDKDANGEFQYSYLRHILEPDAPKVNMAQALSEHVFSQPDLSQPMVMASYLPGAGEYIGALHDYAGVEINPNAVLKPGSDKTLISSTYMDGSMSDLTNEQTCTVIGLNQFNNIFSTTVGAIPVYGDVITVVKDSIWAAVGAGLEISEAFKDHKPTTFVQLQLMAIELRGLHKDADVNSGFLPGRRHSDDPTYERRRKFWYTNDIDKPEFYEMMGSGFHKLYGFASGYDLSYVRNDALQKIRDYYEDKGVQLPRSFVPITIRDSPPADMGERMAKASEKVANDVFAFDDPWKSTVNYLSFGALGAVELQKANKEAILDKNDGKPFEWKFSAKMHTIIIEEQQYDYRMEISYTVVQSINWMSSHPGSQTGPKIDDHHRDLAKNHIEISFVYRFPITKLVLELHPLYDWYLRSTYENTYSFFLYTDNEEFGYDSFVATQENNWTAEFLLPGVRFTRTLKLYVYNRAGWPGSLRKLRMFNGDREWEIKANSEPQRAVTVMDLVEDRWVEVSTQEMVPPEPEDTVVPRFNVSDKGWITQQEYDDNVRIPPHTARNHLTSDELEWVPEMVRQHIAFNGNGTQFVMNFKGNTVMSRRRPYTLERYRPLVEEGPRPYQITPTYKEWKVVCEQLVYKLKHRVNLVKIAFCNIPLENSAVQPCVLQIVNEHNQWFSFPCRIARYLPYDVSTTMTYEILNLQKRFELNCECPLNFDEIKGETVKEIRVFLFRHTYQNIRIKLNLYERKLDGTVGLVADDLGLWKPLHMWIPDPTRLVLRSVPSYTRSIALPSASKNYIMTGSELQRFITPEQTHLGEVLQNPAPTRSMGETWQLAFVGENVPKVSRIEFVNVHSDDFRDNTTVPKHDSNSIQITGLNGHYDYTAEGFNDRYYIDAPAFQRVDVAIRDRWRWHIQQNETVRVLKAYIAMDHPDRWTKHEVWAYTEVDTGIYGKSRYWQYFHGTWFDHGEYTMPNGQRSRQPVALPGPHFVSPHAIELVFDDRRLSPANHPYTNLRNRIVSDLEAGSGLVSPEIHAVYIQGVSVASVAQSTFFIEYSCFQDGQDPKRKQLAEFRPVGSFYGFTFRDLTEVETVTAKTQARLMTACDPLHSNVVNNSHGQTVVMSVDHKVVVVGAPMEDFVTVHIRGFQTVLDGEPGTFFGHSLAISHEGNLLAVAGFNGSPTQFAYVDLFARSTEDTWTKTSTLTLSHCTGKINLSMNAAGTSLAVGCAYTTISSDPRGPERVLMYELVDGEWTQFHSIRSDTDEFGRSLDIADRSGDIVVTSKEYVRVYTKENVPVLEQTGAQYSEVTSGPTSGTYHKVAMSADGKYRLWGAVGRAWMVSSDHGITWSDIYGGFVADTVHDCAMSSDGKYMMYAYNITNINSTLYNTIMASSDYGQTWTHPDFPLRSLQLLDQKWPTGVTDLTSCPQQAQIFAYTANNLPGNGVWLTLDFGVNWVLESSGNGTERLALAYKDNNLFVFKLSPFVYSEETVPYNFISYDEVTSGPTWGNRQVVAMSADGKYRLFGGYDSVWFFSSDHGANWVDFHPGWNTHAHQGRMDGCDVSPSGKNVVFCYRHHSTYSRMIVSTDYGQTWSDPNAGLFNYNPYTIYDIALCKHAGHEDAVAYIINTDGHCVRFSPDMGVTWIDGPSNNRQATRVALVYKDAALSIITNSNNDGLWVASSSSLESWQRWCSYPVNQNPQTAMAVSPNGQYVLVASTTSVWYSGDSGQTWTEASTQFTGTITDLAVTPDGKKAWATTDNVSASIYQSNDYGATWKVEPGRGSKNSVAINQDGSSVMVGQCVGNAPLLQGSQTTSIIREIDDSADISLPVHPTNRSTLFATIKHDLYYYSKDGHFYNNVNSIGWPLKTDGTGIEIHRILIRKEDAEATDTIILNHSGHYAYYILIYHTRRYRVPQSGVYEHTDWIGVKWMWGGHVFTPFHTNAPHKGYGGDPVSHEPGTDYIELHNQETTPTLTDLLTQKLEEGITAASTGHPWENVTLGSINKIGQIGDSSTSFKVEFTDSSSNMFHADVTLLRVGSLGMAVPGSASTTEERTDKVHLTIYPIVDGSLGVGEQNVLSFPDNTLGGPEELAVSQNGQYILVGCQYGVWHSSNTGTSWSKATMDPEPNGTISGMSVSTDGKIASMTQIDVNSIYESVDYGVTWKVASGYGAMSSVAVSQDGSCTMVGSKNGALLQGNYTDPVSIREINDSADISLPMHPTRSQNVFGFMASQLGWFLTVRHVWHAPSTPITIHRILVKKGTEGSWNGILMGTEINSYHVPLLYSSPGGTPRWVGLRFKNVHPVGPTLNTNPHTDHVDTYWHFQDMGFDVPYLQPGMEYIELHNQETAPTLTDLLTQKLEEGIAKASADHPWKDLSLGSVEKMFIPSHLSIVNINGSSTEFTVEFSDTVERKYLAKITLLGTGTYGEAVPNTWNFVEKNIDLFTGTQEYPIVGSHKIVRINGAGTHLAVASVSGEENIHVGHGHTFVDHKVSVQLIRFDGIEEDPVVFSHTVNPSQRALGTWPSMDFSYDGNTIAFSLGPKTYLYRRLPDGWTKDEDDIEQEDGFVSALALDHDSDALAIGSINSMISAVRMLFYERGQWLPYRNHNKKQRVKTLVYDGQKHYMFKGEIDRYVYYSLKNQRVYVDGIVDFDTYHSHLNESSSMVDFGEPRELRKMFLEFSNPGHHNGFTYSKLKLYDEQHRPIRWTVVDDPVDDQEFNIHATVWNDKSAVVVLPTHPIGRKDIFDGLRGDLGPYWGSVSAGSIISWQLHRVLIPSVSAPLGWYSIKVNTDHNVMNQPIIAYMSFRYNDGRPDAEEWVGLWYTNVNNEPILINDINVRTHSWGIQLPPIEYVEVVTDLDVSLNELITMELKTSIRRASEDHPWYGTRFHSIDSIYAPQHEGEIDGRTTPFSVRFTATTNTGEKKTYLSTVTLLGSTYPIATPSTDDGSTGRLLINTVTTAYRATVKSSNTDINSSYTRSIYSLAVPENTTEKDDVWYHCKQESRHNLHNPPSLTPFPCSLTYPVVGEFAKIAFHGTNIVSSITFEDLHTQLEPFFIPKEQNVHLYVRRYSGWQKLEGLIPAYGSVGFQERALKLVLEPAETIFQIIVNLKTGLPGRNTAYNGCGAAKLKLDGPLLFERDKVDIQFSSVSPWIDTVQGSTRDILYGSGFWLTNTRTLTPTEALRLRTLHPLPYRLGLTDIGRNTADANLLQTDDRKSCVWLRLHEPVPMSSIRVKPRSAPTSGSADVEVHAYSSLQGWSCVKHRKEHHRGTQEWRKEGLVLWLGDPRNLPRANRPVSDIVVYASSSFDLFLECRRWVEDNDILYQNLPVGNNPRVIRECRIEPSELSPRVRLFYSSFNGVSAMDLLVNQGVLDPAIGWASSQVLDPARVHKQAVTPIDILSALYLNAGLSDQEVRASIPNFFSIFGGKALGSVVALPQLTEVQPGLNDPWDYGSRGSLRIWERSVFNDDQSTVLLLSKTLESPVQIHKRTADGDSFAGIGTIPTNPGETVRACGLSGNGVVGAIYTTPGNILSVWESQGGPRTEVIDSVPFCTSRDIVLNTDGNTLYYTTNTNEGVSELVEYYFDDTGVWLRRTPSTVLTYNSVFSTDTIIEPPSLVYSNDLLFIVSNYQETGTDITYLALLAIRPFGAYERIIEYRDPTPYTVGSLLSAVPTTVNHRFSDNVLVGPIGTSSNEKIFSWSEEGPEYLLTGFYYMTVGWENGFVAMEKSYSDLFEPYLLHAPTRSDIFTDLQVDIQQYWPQKVDPSVHTVNVHRIIVRTGNEAASLYNIRIATDVHQYFVGLYATFQYSNGQPDKKEWVGLKWKNVQNTPTLYTDPNTDGNYVHHIGMNPPFTNQGYTEVHNYNLSEPSLDLLRFHLETGFEPGCDLPPACTMTYGQTTLNFTATTKKGPYHFREPVLFNNENKQLVVTMSNGLVDTGNWFFFGVKTQLEEVVPLQIPDNSWYHLTPTIQDPSFEDNFFHSNLILPLSVSPTADRIGFCNPVSGRATVIHYSLPEPSPGQLTTYYAHPTKTEAIATHHHHIKLSFEPLILKGAALNLEVYGGNPGDTLKVGYLLLHGEAWLGRFDTLHLTTSHQETELNFQQSNEEVVESVVVYLESGGSVDQVFRVKARLALLDSQGTKINTVALKNVRMAVGTAPEIKSTRLLDGQKFEGDFSQPTVPHTVYYPWGVALDVADGDTCTLQDNGVIVGKRSRALVEAYYPISYHSEVLATGIGQIVPQPLASEQYEYIQRDEYSYRKYKNVPLELEMLKKITSGRSPLPNSSIFNYIASRVEYTDLKRAILDMTDTIASLPINTELLQGDTGTQNLFSQTKVYHRDQVVRGEPRTGFTVFLDPGMVVYLEPDRYRGLPTTVSSPKNGQIIYAIGQGYLRYQGVSIWEPITDDLEAKMPRDRIMITRISATQYEIVPRVFYPLVKYKGAVVTSFPLSVNEGDRVSLNNLTILFKDGIHRIDV